MSERLHFSGFCGFPGAGHENSSRQVKTAKISKVSSKIGLGLSKKENKIDLVESLVNKKTEKKTEKKEAVEGAINQAVGTVFGGRQQDSTTRRTQPVRTYRRRRY